MTIIANIFLLVSESSLKPSSNVEAKIAVVVMLISPIKIGLKI
jgi:hypothetical protein